ncbi:ester cyclase [uncultured Tateyamaria sp.]|uniref:ester cyclase n=1 Tax=uncultured Tateyamaria sp. TaxID=455651 RepID=UPI0026166858|nr:nuclear transport factor 2 family protein [uncultured Tateyamaria sp.]
MPNKVKTLQGWYDEVWTNGDLEAIPKFLAPNARSRGIMGDMPFAIDDLEDLVTMVRELLGTIEITLPITMEQDDWLSALVEIKSHAADTGDPVHVFGQVIARFDGGKMVEIYTGTDSLTLFEQLGMLPENAMAVMLGGTRLR